MSKFSPLFQRQDTDLTGKNNVSGSTGAYPEKEKLEKTPVVMNTSQYNGHWLSMSINTSDHVKIKSAMY